MKAIRDDMTRQVCPAMSMREITATSHNCVCRVFFKFAIPGTPAPNLKTLRARFPGKEVVPTEVIPGAPLAIPFLPVAV